MKPERLTIQTKNGYLHKLGGDDPIYTDEQRKSDLDAIIQKLGQLEDIEDELGIDLVTLFKALDEGFYDCNGKYVDPVLYCGLVWCLYDRDNIYGDRYSLNDYGKTWALTMEELE